MELKTLFNRLLWQYKKCQTKLQRLIETGRNLHRQSVMRKRLNQLRGRLISMKDAVRLATAGAAVAGTLLFFGPDAGAQTVFSEQVGFPYNPLNARPKMLANSTPAFVDIDDDGDLDFFGGGKIFKKKFIGAEVKYFCNKGDPSSARFKEMPAASNPLNLLLGGYGFDTYSVNLSFVDIDNDGDFDMFAGVYYSEALHYYKNNGTNTAPAFAAPISVVGDNGKLGDPTFGDLDNDGDFDLICGNSDGVFAYYKNTGTANAFSFVKQMGGDNPMDGFDVGINSTPYFSDIDNDSDLDIISGSEGGQYKYYKNTGSAVAPTFSEQLGADNPLNGINTGLATAPELIDIDNDGDFDLVSGAATGEFNLLENTGTSSAPIFAVPPYLENPLEGLQRMPFCAPGFVDINGDGKKDVFLGNLNGTFRYFNNTGTNIVPLYSELAGSDNPLNGVDVGDNATPTFLDIDGDGDFDLFSGCKLGKIFFYKNIGSTNAPVFALQTGSGDPLLGVDVGSNSAPAFVNINNDNDYDLFCGNDLGKYRYFENTGSASVPIFVERTGSVNPLSVFDVGLNATPTFADLDFDGDFDLLGGSKNNGITYYRNTGTLQSAVFEKQTGTNYPLGLYSYLFSTPTLVDINNDGKSDLFYGEEDGQILYFQNVSPPPSPALLLAYGSPAIYLTDGDNTPSVNEGTDFQSINIGATLVRNFTIHSVGYQTLVIDSVSVGGANASRFSVSPINNVTLNIGATMALTIAYSPTSASNDNAIIHIYSNDLDASDFDFAVKGCGPIPWYLDVDGDGYYASTVFACENPGSNYYPSRTGGGDCNDNDVNIHPGVAEIVCNMVDDNCDGNIDLQVNVVVTNATCVANGSINVTPLDDTPPYTYLWNDGVTTEDRSNLPAGLYKVTVTGGSGCTKASPNITLGTSSFTATIVSFANPTCFGGNNGTITAGTTQGTGGISYLWNNGTTTPTISGIGAGTYTVTATNGQGCTSTISKTLGQPTQISANITSSNPTCNGGNNGSATVTATGGTGAKTYLWSTGATTTNISGLGGGTFTVTVSDANGCTVTSFVTLTLPPPYGPWYLDADNDGFYTGAIVNACYSPGTGYTNSAIGSGDCNDGNPNINPAAMELCNGIDDDCDGLIDDNTVSISYVRTNVTCRYANNGSIAVTLVGGTAPFTYLWNDGATTEDRTGLAPGTYKLTVTELNGCTKTTPNINISQPPALNVSVVTTNPNCSNVNDGTAAATATGGTGTKIFLWNTGATTATITGLSAGTYTVTVTDANGCTKLGTAIVQTPPTATAWYLDADADGYYTGNSMTTCTSPGTGYVTSVIGGGDCNDSDVSIFPNAVEVCNGVDDDCDTEIDESSFTLTYTASNVTCNNYANGTINITLNGPGAPFFYQWSDGATTEDRSGLAPGFYHLTITASNNSCPLILQNVQITQPTKVILSVTSVNIFCEGFSTGTATANATGGTGNKNYLWSNGATTSAIINLSAGNYAVTATDANGCSKTVNRVITQPPPLVPNFSIVPIAGNQYKVTLTASGGTPYPAPNLYRYCKVNNGACTFATTKVFSNLLPNVTYEFRTRDANLCEKNLLVTTPNTMAGEISMNRGEENFPKELSVYPNPATSEANVLLPIGQGSGMLRIVDLIGKTVWHQRIETDENIAKQITVLLDNNLPKGMYFIHLHTANGAAFIEKFEIADN